MEPPVGSCEDEQASEEDGLAREVEIVIRKSNLKDTTRHSRRPDPCEPFYTWSSEEPTVT